MISRRDIIDFYNGGGSFRTVQDLNRAIIDLHASSNYKAAELLIREGEEILNDPESLGEAERIALEARIRAARALIDEKIQDNALANPLELNYFAEWDREQKTINLLLPFREEEIIDGFSIAGLSRWYVRSNKRVMLRTSSYAWGNYGLFEISSIPDLNAVEETLDQMVNPPEFEQLNLLLYPTMTRIYRNKYQTTGLEPIYFPKKMHPIRVSNYQIIMDIVGKNWDAYRQGMSSGEVFERHNSTSLGNVTRYLKDMSDEGYLHRTGTPNTRFLYFSLRAFANGR